MEFTITPRAQGCVSLTLDSEAARTLAEYLDEASEHLSDALDADWHSHGNYTKQERDAIRADCERASEWSKDVRRVAFEDIEP